MWQIRDKPGVCDLLTILVVAGALGMGGCAGTSNRAEVGQVRRSVKPIMVRENQARSLALGSPVVRQQRTYYAQRGITPSYYDRLDRHPAVTIGVQSPTVRRSVTTTYDSLHTTPRGDVHDHYHRTTHRFRATQAVQ